MGVFEMVVLIVLIATVGKIADSFASRHRGGADPALQRRVENLEHQLESSESRVSHAEGKVVQLEEKLEFMEKLLAPPVEGRR